MNYLNQVLIGIFMQVMICYQISKNRGQDKQEYFD